MLMQQAALPRHESAMGVGAAKAPYFQFNDEP